MNNFTITFQSNLVAVYIILAVIALGISWWSYRNSVPQISQLKRGFLIFLRFLGIFLLAVLLIEPLLTSFSEKITGNKLGVVYDLSSSMMIEDDGLNRFNGSMQALSELESISYSKNYYGFTDSLIDLRNPPDSALVNGRSTDLSVAISEPLARSGDELGAILLVTDGAGNIGIDPLSAAMKSDVPVYSLVMGQAISFSDVAITKIDYPPVSYINTEITITAEIKASGYEGRQALLEIRDQGKAIATKTVKLPSDGAFITVDFPVVFNEEGVHSLKAVLGAFEDESFADNNTRSFTIKLLKDKTSILLLSSSLNWEYTFLKRALESDSHFEVKSAIASGSNSIPGRELPGNLNAWQELDLIIAMDVPSRAVGAKVNDLKAAVESGTGFLFLSGDNTRLMPLGAWDDMLPLSISGRVSQESGEFFPLPGEQAVVKSLTDIEDLNWNELSPLEFLFTGFEIENNAIIFLDAVAVGNQNTPVLVGGSYKRGKTAATLGYPWWKRTFRPADERRSSEAMIQFWGNLVRWLIARDDLDKFNLVSDKTVYRLGEPVKFDAILFDDSYNLLNGAQINVEIIDSIGSEREFRLTSTNEGRYSGTYGSPAAGEYDFTGYAIWEDDTVGVSRGNFLIESFSLEMENPSANFSLMRQIASLTGGVSYTPDNFSDFNKDLKLKIKSADVFTEYSPTGNTILLILIIAAFSAEWAIRKFSQLP